MKVIEKILFVCIMALMILPAIQKAFRIIPVSALQGDFVLAKKPSFSWKDWNNGSYQENFDIWLEDHIGFRNFFVMLNNQIDYSFFDEVHADGVVKGKNNVFFEYDYIREYTGQDFLGEFMIDRRMRQFKFVQKHLKEKLGIDLVLVFEPGKAAYLPEYIPDNLLENTTAPTNHDVYTTLAEQYGINYIDWNSWYINTLKQKTSYPIYTKYGIHWSEYGMTYALDSMINFIEKTRKIDLREMTLDSLIIENRSRTPDYDIGVALNLLFRLPENQQFAYPVYSFGPVEGKDFPKVLIVGDSYYWNIYNTKIANELFGNQAFWYFNNLVYPNTYYDTTTVADLNIKEEVEKQDVIFLMVTGRFLYKFDWGFIDKLYELYGVRSKYDQIYSIMTQITGYDVWFANVINQATEKEASLSEMLALNAHYFYETNNLNDYLVVWGQEYFEKQILNDAKWLSEIKEKAAENKISQEKMIQKEADYLFQSNYPESWEKYQKLQQFKAEIKSDPVRLLKVKEEAAYYYLTLEEMLQIAAERMLEKAL